MSSSSAQGGGSPQAARRTLPHRTPTGHWAPQPSLPEPQLLYRAQLSALSAFAALPLMSPVSSCKATMLSCFPSHDIVTMTCCALSLCPGTKPERPRSTRSSFCAAPPKCNAAEHCPLLLASQCLRRVKSALLVHWESAAGPQTLGKLSPTCLPRPSYPARPLGIFSFEQRFTMGKCETVRCMLLWDILL